MRIGAIVSAGASGVDALGMMMRCPTFILCAGRAIACRRRDVHVTWPTQVEW